jgi:hypothetical protein
MGVYSNETPVSRLSWVQEWCAEGSFESAAKCAKQRVAELMGATPEELAAIPASLWEQVKLWSRLSEEDLSKHLSGIYSRR